MQKALQQILLQLPGLDQPDLLKLKTRVDALLTIQTVGSTSEQEDWLGAGICYALRVKGLTRAKNFHSPERNYVKASKEIREWLLSKLKDLRPVEKLALGRVAGEALRDYVATYSVPNSQQLMRSVMHIPQALEASFPGYLQAGMLCVLIKERTHHAQDDDDAPRSGTQLRPVGARR